MKRGDHVKTFTGATGRIVELLPCRRVLIALIVHVGNGKTTPRRPREVACEAIYLRDDVKVLGATLAYQK